MVFAALPAVVKAPDATLPMEDSAVPNSDVLVVLAVPVSLPPV